VSGYSIGRGTSFLSVFRLTIASAIAGNTAVIVCPICVLVIFLDLAAK
jgi:hypothetical protein